jgi:hypothetical protein
VPHDRASGRSRLRQPCPKLRRPEDDPPCLPASNSSPKPADVAAPIILGPGLQGERRVVPILGGRIAGPRLEGEVLPGGTDHQLIRPDGVTEIVARYTLRLTDGALVHVVNSGLRHAAPEDMARLLRGEPVPPERVYFRTTPVFETAAPDHAWLQHRQVFLGYGERQPSAVIIRIHAA